MSVVAVNRSQKSNTGMHTPELIISGGQTGADEGALLAAWNLGIATGGFAPRDYKTEAGPRSDLGSVYGLVESHSTNYAVRTEQNIKMADAVIIVARNFASPGTKLTIEIATFTHHKPVFSVSYPAMPSLESDTLLFDVTSWLDFHKPTVLMVAGNRESKARGIQRWTEEFIIKLFT